MLGRTNISDEESEQVRDVTIDGSMEFSITSMEKNIQHGISDVFWELHVWKLTSAAHLVKIILV